MRPFPQGSQQSVVRAQPLVKYGMHGGDTHTPVASGLPCWQTSPGAHTGGGARRFPPHGPPGPETHGQNDPATGPLPHVLPVGHSPAHVANGVGPQPPVGSVVVVVGRTQSAEGPGQQLCVAPASRQRQACSHCPFTQRSAVQKLPSVQSASPSHDVRGRVVVVVGGPQGPVHARKVVRHPSDPATAAAAQVRRHEPLVVLPPQLRTHALAWAITPRAQPASA